jgi:hypothetical protein
MKYDGILVNLLKSTEFIIELVISPEFINYTTLLLYYTTLDASLIMKPRVDALFFNFIKLIVLFYI